MIRIVRVEEDSEFEAIFRIRKKVFVEEQAVPEEEEWDEFEHISKHYMALYHGNPVGTARWRRTLSGDYKLERFAVLSEFRNLGIGKALVAAVLEDVPKYPDSSIYLHAQISAKRFYERLGFKPYGEIFEEAGILHIKMCY